MAKQCSVSDELVKLKELLDADLITREEFDNLKASLLNQNTLHTDNNEQQINNQYYSKNSNYKDDYSNVGIIDEHQKENPKYKENTINKYSDVGVISEQQEDNLDYEYKYSNIGVINEPNATDSSSIKSSIHLWIISIASIVAYACLTNFAIFNTDVNETISIIFTMLSLPLFILSIIFFVKAIKSDSANGNKRNGIKIALLVFIIFVLIPSFIMTLFLT